MPRLLISLLMTSIVSQAIGQEVKNLSSTQVLKAIEIFGSEPLSHRGRGMSSIIVSFAEDSDSVSVNLDFKLYPWFGEEPRVKHEPQLLTAMIAGSLKSQLKSGTNKEVDYSGMLFVFRVYNQIKQEDESFVIPLIEKQLQLHRNGELHDYIAKTMSNKTKKIDSQKNRKSHSSACCSAHPLHGQRD